MTYKEILKLPEGAHVVTVNTERCMVVRLREGYTLTTVLSGAKAHSAIQRAWASALGGQGRQRFQSRLQGGMTMKVLIVEPGKNPRTDHISPELSSLQATVGGYIQAIYPWDDPVAVVCDEEALLKESEFNRLIAPEVAIFGTFFICGLGDEDFTDLPDAMIAKYAQLLHDPEVLIRTAKGCAAVCVTAKVDL